MKEEKMKKIHFNIIDVLLIVLIAVFCMLFFSMKNRTSGVIHSNTANYKIIFETDAQTKEMLEGIKVGDKLFSENHAESGVVTKIEVFPFAETDINSHGVAVALRDKDYYMAHIYADMTASVSNSYIEFNGESVKAGQQYRFRTDLFESFGKIMYMEDAK